MDIILDVTSKSPVSSATYRSSLPNGFGLGDNEPINIWLLKPTVPVSPTAPWSENYAGSIGFEVSLTATVSGARTVLASASASAAAASVTHPSGSWDGWTLDLDVTGDEITTWLGANASRDARLEVTWIDGTNRTTWVSTVPVHTVAGQIASRRLREYRFTGIPTDATSFQALPLPTGTDFTATACAYMIETETLPVGSGTAFVIAYGFSTDGTTAGTEIDDSLTDDGNNRYEINAAAATTQGGSDTHVYVEFTTAGSYDLDATVIVYGYEEPS